MIKVATEKGHTSVRLDGSFAGLCTDALCVVEGIHNAFKQESDEAADEFEKFFKKHIDDVFNGDKERVILAKVSGKDEIRRLLEHLEEMISDED